MIRMRNKTPLLRKTPLRRSSWIRNAKPLRAVSPAKRRDIEEGKAARLLVLDRDRHCVLCPEPISDVHHRLPRGSGGAMADPTRWALSRLVGLCRAHHTWTEYHREAAEGLGLLLRHGVSLPCEVPVWRHGEMVWLSDDGSISRPGVAS